MADNFCTQCGKRLTGAARFCSNCGNPVGVRIESGSRFLERAPAQPEALGVPASLLNGILACSMMNAPLTTEFLLVQDQKQCRRLIPLEFVGSLKGLEVLSGVGTAYLVKDMDFAVRNCYFTVVSNEVRETFLETEKHTYLNMVIHPSFESRHYGEVDKDIRGNWLSTVTEIDKQDYCTVVTVAPLTTSCEIMRERLRRYETILKNSLADEEDPSRKEGFNTRLKDLRTVIQEIPEKGFADHIHCRAYLVTENEFQDTVLLDEEPEATPAFRSIAVTGKSRSLRIPVPATTDFKRCLMAAPPARNILRRLRSE